MNSRRCGTAPGGWLWLVFALLFSPLVFAAAPPLNVVFILADDLGAHDLGCYGADLHETPNIDRLAREGVRFTQAYAMSVCSPTRAAILTGKHAARLHLTTWRESAEKPTRDKPLLPPPAITDLPYSETTIAEALKPAGYLTLHVGKWHLGDAGHSPESQGFDLNIGGTHWGAPTTFYHPFSGPTGTAREFRYVPGLGLGQPGDYLTDRLTDEALKLIETAGDRPFFLELWHHSPHTPIEGKPQQVEYFQRKLKPGLRHQNAAYAAMIQSLDDSVGRVLDLLQKRGLADRTLVIFASDNGGYTNPFRDKVPTDNWPLRSGKGSLYEGGIRVPLIVRLPGVTPKGVTCNEPVMCEDFYPTIVELCGDAAARQAVRGGSLDGFSLVPLLKDPQSHLQRDALFFHYPHYYFNTTPVSAVRVGDWKLLEYLEDNHSELYNLRDDPGEAHDLASQQPGRAAELRTRLHQWWQDAGAQLPQKNPDFQPKAK
ncbi:MAG: sulfatase [Verrucomicrobiota bacterium]